MIYRTDYHVHTAHSDGRADPEEYIAPAIAAGLSEIGFSDHLTLFLDPQEWNMDPADVPAYFNHMLGLKEKTKGIIVRAGLEVDYFEGKEDETRAFLNSLPLDYIIGSVHYQGEKTVDFGPEFYEGRNIDQLYEAYFETVVSAAGSRLFDIIGHCDIIRIMGYRPLKDTEPLYRRIARAMKQNDIVFEVNTNGKNKPVGDFYPDRNYLHVFREEGVPVCVNSDAHFPKRIAQYFDEAYELLGKAGYNEMAVFENRKRRMVPF